MNAPVHGWVRDVPVVQPHTPAVQLLQAVQSLLALVFVDPLVLFERRNFLPQCHTRFLQRIYAQLQPLPALARR